MKVVEKDIESIREYEHNPRKNEEAVDKVAASIREFGFKVPVVVDADGVIVAGHTRIKAARKLGIDKIPCIVADDLTEEQIKAFRLADNKVGEFAEWDFELLDDELQDINDIDMSEFGFDDSDVEEIEDSEEDDEFEDIEKLERHYGVPYQGNKSRIADIIISLLPAGKRLVELFGGGGAQLRIALCCPINGIHSYITI